MNPPHMNPSPEQRMAWLRFFPPSSWLAAYRREWLPSDAIAGVTLAAYAIPVSLAYAALAGLPPQVGIYGYLLGGIGYALLGSSRQLAVGPTSAISLMIASTVGVLAGGDAVRYAQIASLAACAVAVLCFIAWLFKLSVLVRLVSDSILVGFKAGAGLTIIMSQLPSLFGVAGGGHNFFDAFRLAVAARRRSISHPGDRCGRASASIARRTVSAGQAGRHYHCGAIDLWRHSLVFHPWAYRSPEKSRRIAVAWVADVRAAGTRRSLSARRGLRAAGLHRRCLRGPQLCGQHGYALDVRQEFLGLGAANLAAAFGHGYPVAGGLSQSAVNDSAGARTPLALVVCSVTLALCLLFFTGLLTNLPKAVLAAIVFAAVYRLVDIRALVRMWRVKPDRLLRCSNCAGLCAAARESCKAFCLRRSLPSSCCSCAPRTRMSRSLGESREAAATPTLQGMRAWNRW